MSTFALVTALVLAPLLGALALRCAHVDEARTALAAAFAACTLSLSLVLLWRFEGGTLEVSGPVLPLLGEPLRVGLDGYGVVLLPLVSAVALVLIVAGRRAAQPRESLAATLATTGATLALLVTRDLLVFVLAFVLTLAPSARLVMGRGDRLLGRTYGVFMLVSTLPLVLCVGVVARHALAHGLRAPFSLDALEALGLPVAWQPALFALLTTSVLARAAIAPFHGWLPVLFERGPFGVALLLTQAEVGLHLLLRVALPLLPEGARLGLPFIVAIGLAGCLHGAVLALVQVDLRRMLAYLVSSQAGMVLLGVGSMSQESVGGALLEGVASTIAITGVAIVIWALEGRTGTVDTRALGGLVRRMPRTAAFFLLLGFAAIGFPGALTFIAEDLLVHGVLHVHPLLAWLMLLATAINGITLFRAFSRTFLGELDEARYARVAPLRLRERFVLLTLLATTLALGARPSGLLALRALSVAKIVGYAAEPGSSERRPPLDGRRCRAAP